MKKLILSIFAGSILLTYGCHKTPNNTTTTVTDSAVLSDFVSVIALPEYQNLQVKATALNDAVTTLNSTTTEANLQSAQQAWRDIRTSWETCEGFLFGPVEDNFYDPNTDTWPVDYTSLDSVIANNSTFSVSMVANLTQNLRGYHPLEFILWGQNGTATSDSLTTPQKGYMVALSQYILTTVDSLNLSWSTTGGNFQQQILTAGKGATYFTSRQSAMLAIVSAMSDICNEVGQQTSDGKIYAPFAARDSFMAESPFSHNSLSDFVNNIKGAQDAYLCTYNGQSGASISAFVAQNNTSLDNTIKQQFTAAISALNNVTGTFETAIFTERNQLQSAMTALNTLQTTLDGSLTTYVKTYVKD